MFCELNYEFDLDFVSCKFIVYDYMGSGCMVCMYRNLLL